METTLADDTETECSSDEEGGNEGLQNDESTCGLQGEERASGGSQTAVDENNEAPNDERNVEHGDVSADAPFTDSRVAEDDRMEWDLVSSACNLETHVLYSITNASFILLVSL